MRRLLSKEMGIVDYLKTSQGAKKRRKRLGRGSGSGHGKTCGHGNKGQQAHGRTKAARGFEGGQMPLIRRIPKRGFINRFRKVYQVINIKSLAPLAEENITPDILKAKGLIKSGNTPLKVLGEGELKKKMDISAHAFSRKAKEIIEKAGGKATVIS